MALSFLPQYFGRRLGQPGVYWGKWDEDYAINRLEPLVSLEDGTDRLPLPLAVSG